MHIQEAVWINNVLSGLDRADISPLINIGSSTYKFRTQSQPFIDAEIFAPLRSREVRVIHTDIKQDDGVDLVGDILLIEFRQQVKKLGVKAILCSNLLEHVEALDEFWDAIHDLVSDGGYLIITVPYKYPKHMDPIDTLYRPSPIEIIERCDNYKLIDARVVKVGRPIWSFIFKPHLLLLSIIRLILPFYKYSGWVTVLNKVLYAFRMREISCVAIQKVRTLRLDNE